ncbi:N-acetyl sugar amidotransferase [Hyphomonas sp.]|jgi:N-acetyl sugar amidotransferase|uniref:N-acetyl sugar amidotransferase n=1 Tax=Hyphomonas sp. TaxID=87 RepID=UPI0037BE35DF
MAHDVEKWQRRSGARIFAPSTGYRVCTRCIMDTSDPEIVFDEAGVCNHCHDYERRLAGEVYPGVKGKQQLAKAVAQIKREGAGKKYDCILGLSGGVDSTYVAYVTKQLGLRPLAVHLDNGWNSEISVRNIENIVTILGIDLHTEVLDWEEFRRLQVAFLRASTPDSEIPTDHAIIATLYRLAADHGIRWIMDGSNIVTEIMVPATWSHGHSDWGYIKHLNDTFGGAELKTYPHYDYYDYMVRFPHRDRIQRFPLLNYIDFNKMEAMEIMKKELNWTPYGGKHYESIYTRFYQGYILPKKFGFDKRRSHLSCLVANGRMTRDEALAEIQKPALSEEMEREDRVFVAKKLGLSDAEFDGIMNAERKTFWDYPSSERDLPGTKKYMTFIRAAQFHSGDWTRSTAARLNARLISTRTFPARAWRRLRTLHVDPVGTAAALGRFLRRTAGNAGSSLLRNVMKLTVPLIRPVGNWSRRRLSPEQFERFKSFARKLYAGGRIEPDAAPADLKETTQ